MLSPRPYIETIGYFIGVERRLLDRDHIVRHIGIRFGTTQIKLTLTARRDDMPRIRLVSDDADAINRRAGRKGLRIRASRRQSLSPAHAIALAAVSAQTDKPQTYERRE